MRRKIRTKLIMIAVVLAAIFIVYQDQTPQTYAKDGKEQSRAQSIQTDNPGGAVDPDNPDDSEKPEEPEKPVVKYELACPEADGENGYYVTKPEVVITHVSAYGMTRFRYTNVNGQIQEGELKDKDSKSAIGPEQFQEGRSSLAVWMEDEEGKKIGGMDWSREFLIDTLPPKIQLGAPQGLDAWYQKELALSVTAPDGEQGSQTGKLACSIGNKRIGTSEKAQAVFAVQAASVNGAGVPVTVSAIDYAGNQSQVSHNVYIDNAPPQVLVEGPEDYMITSQPLEVCYRIKEDNILETASARTEWEHVDGQKSELPQGEWKEDGDGQVLKEQLSEDGIYRMSVAARDKAGYEMSQTSQVIIDRHNPVIRYVDTLNGQYIKEFKWEYPMESLIQDFTTFVYEVRLDDRLYSMGSRVTKEGVHTLSVKAVDAAGNQAEAKAQFTIDRTPPQIRFLNIEEDGTYEEQHAFKVALKDQEDMITKIQIDGANQKVNPRSKVYEFQAEEHKDHLVSVKASDRAGNTSEAQIRFKITEKQSPIEKLLKPLTKRPNGGKSKAETAVSAGTQEKHMGNYVWIGAAVLGIVAAGGAVYYVIRRKKKEEEKESL